MPVCVRCAGCGCPSTSRSTVLFRLTWISSGSWTLRELWSGAWRLSCSRSAARPRRAIWTSPALRACRPARSASCALSRDRLPCHRSGSPVSCGNCLPGARSCRVPAHSRASSVSSSSTTCSCLPSLPYPVRARDAIVLLPSTERNRRSACLVKLSPDRALCLS